MSVPGFAAEASLLKTQQAYRGYCGTAGAGAAWGVVPSAPLCGSDCWLGCTIGSGVACGPACVLGIGVCVTSGGILCELGLGFCLLACGGQVVDCILNCPDCPGGGGGGPPECCQAGTSCRCGGRCVPGRGCIGGRCLRPTEECP
jgi:hypothetical protein